VVLYSFAHCKVSCPVATAPGTGSRKVFKQGSNVLDRKEGVATKRIRINYLLTYDSYVPLYNRFHRGEWITRVSGGEGALDTPGPLNGTSEASAIWAQECVAHTVVWGPYCCTHYSQYKLS
jgi:hypothetical protein